MRVELLAWGFALLVFALDLLLDPDLPAGALYAGVVVATVWSRRPASTWVAAAVCTLLIAIPPFLHPPQTNVWLTFLHRLFDAFAVWSIGIVASLRQRTEERVAEQAEKMRLAVEGARLGLFDWHLPSGQFEGNGRLAELLGAGDRPLDRPIEDFFAHVHPDDREAVGGWFSRILESATPADTEYRYLLPDGGLRWLSSHCRAYRDRAGRVDRICGVLHDVTPRRLADEAHWEAEERLRLALAAAEFGVFDWDPRTDVARIDARFAQIYGLETPPGPCSGASLRACIHPDDRAHVGALIRTIHEGGDPRQSEYRVLPADGRTRWVAASSRTHHAPDGTVERVIGVIQEVTERKVDEAVREGMVERERSARREAEMLRAAAEAANRTKDEFLAVVSHELRAPLSPMLGWTELLREGELDEEDTREALDTIERNIRSLSHLVSDLLDVSRILAGKLPIATRPTTLEDPVSEAVDSLTDEASRRGITVSVRSEADRRLVSGDPERLRQIAWNLVSNAIKFTPAGGRVDVEILDVGAWIDLRVRDTGKGIEPDVAPHLFERFWQEDGSLTRASGGLGLGLSIVKHLVERHRGAVSVTSPGPGQGSTFTVRLPALKGRRKSAAARPAAPAEPRPGRLVGLRVLAVDDDPATAAATSAVLGHHGAEVLTAGSAAEALSLLERWSPHVLVSDLAMPGTDGFALISEIRRREHDTGSRTPAIALSALARAEDRERALATGFDGYISKPVDAETLAAEIAHAAEHPDLPGVDRPPDAAPRAGY